MFDRFISFVKGTGKWAALIAVIIAILVFAADELAKWQSIHMTVLPVKPVKKIIPDKVPDEPEQNTESDETEDN